MSWFDGATTPELDEIVAAARAAWPNVVLDDRAFVEHLARHAATPEALRTLRTSELYLACACARGDRTAIEAFEAAYFSEIDHAARRTRSGEAIAGETKQRLRKVLFVGRDDSGPAIAEYAGRGDLRGWVRVAATRDLLLLVQRDKREVHVNDEQFLDVLAPAEDPELHYIGELYKAQMTVALRTAFEALDARERRLLRMSVIDGLSIDELAALHGVHRATAARWLAAAREDILARTRAELTRLIGAASAEIDSIVRLLYDRVEVSLERVLATRS